VTRVGHRFDRAAKLLVTDPGPAAMSEPQSLEPTVMKEPGRNRFQVPSASVSARARTPRRTRVAASTETQNPNGSKRCPFSIGWLIKSYASRDCTCLMSKVWLNCNVTGHPNGFAVKTERGRPGNNPSDRLEAGYCLPGELRVPFTSHRAVPRSRFHLRICRTSRVASSCFRPDALARRSESGCGSRAERKRSRWSRRNV